MVLESFKFVPSDLCLSPASVIVHRVLKPSFSKNFPFGGSGGPERTRHLWNRSLSILGPTLQVLGSGPSPGAWMEAGFAVTSCLSF